MNFVNLIASNLNKINQLHTRFTSSIVCSGLELSSFCFVIQIRILAKTYYQTVMKLSTSVDVEESAVK